MTYVIVTLEGNEYGIKIEKVKEVIETNKIKVTPLPLNEDGVISLRDEIISVSELGKYLGFPVKSDIGGNTRIIIESDKDNGYIVDSVREVLNIEQDCIKNNPNPNQYCKKIAKIGDRLISIIDL